MSDKSTTDGQFDFSALEAKLGTSPANDYAHHKESLDKSSFAKKGFFIVLAVGVLLFGGYFTVMKFKAKYFSAPEKEKQVVMTNKEGRADLGLPDTLPLKKDASKPPLVPDSKEAKPIEPIRPIIQPMRLSAKIEQSAQPRPVNSAGGNVTSPLPVRENPYNTTGGMPSPEKAAEAAKKLTDSLMAKMSAGASAGQGALSGLGDSLSRSNANSLASATGGRVVGLTGSLNKAYALGDLSFVVIGSSFIPCVLQNELISSVPGDSVCLVSRDVYSSDGKNILIPKYSKLSGPYKGDVSRGENRITNLFDRITTPDGIEIRMSAQGVGNSGASGLDAEVDNKWFERIGTSLMLAVFQDGINFGSQQLAYNQFLRESWRKEDVAAAQAAADRQNVTSTTRKITVTNPETGVTTETTTVNAPANTGSSNTSNYFGNNTSNVVNPPVWGTDSSRSTMRSLAEKILEDQLKIKSVARVKKSTEIQVYVKESLDFSGVYKNTHVSLAAKQ
jgi:type IV secretory pathway VirB10-like protein